MASFVSVDVSSDPEGQQQEIYDLLASVWPGWVPSEGNLETWFVIAVSYMVAELRDLVGDVSEEIFKQFGATIVGVPPNEPARASADTTWTMVDNAGYTIPADATINIPITGSEEAAFVVQEDTTVAPGGTTIDIVCVALDEGEFANDLDSDPELETPLDFVDSVALNTPTGGGADAEDPTEYLDRLTEELQLLTPKPVLAAEFAIIYKRLPGVDRAIGLDLFNPATDDPDDTATWDTEKAVTVAGIDEDGEPVDAATKTAGVALLESMREVNFIINAIDATYTTIDVTVDGVARPNSETDAVEAAVIAALTDYLSPANWGRPTQGDPGSNSSGWDTIRKVRRLELAEVVNRAAGFDYINTLTLREHGVGALGTTDVDLAGAAPLTRAGDIIVTVSLP